MQATDGLEYHKRAYCLILSLPGCLPRPKDTLRLTDTRVSPRTLIVVEIVAIPPTRRPTSHPPPSFVPPSCACGLVGLAPTLPPIFPFSTRLPSSASPPSCLPNSLSQPSALVRDQRRYRDRASNRRRPGAWSRLPRIHSLSGLSASVEWAPARQHPTRSPIRGHLRFPVPRSPAPLATAVASIDPAPRAAHDARPLPTEAWPRN